jgi:hypothetical protein
MSTVALRFFPVRWLRLVVLTLVSAVMVNSVAYAAPQVAMDAATVRAKVVKRGVGKNVKLVRKDGGEVKGKIVNIGGDGVEVLVKDGIGTVNVAFDDVTAVKGIGVSTLTKVIIGVGTAQVVALVVIKVALDHAFKTSPIP